ncbi:MAG: DEAD/DEAH box helicase [Panacagrimonas sp.]
MTTDSTTPSLRFRDLELPEPLLRALEEVGYESATPIQAQTIPHLLAGRDVLGQAQTGTGKTAAFALPALARTEVFHAVPQTLVLAPTRELAIQVAEAFQSYSRHMAGFHVLPIYGGQSYDPQLKGLRRGVHVIVGTPGRVVDHIKRGSLQLNHLKMLVLDEADEMLRMGFIDDVEWVLQQTPPTRQVALFSATMPTPIRRVAQTHLKSPAEVHIKSKTTTATNIRQRYWMVSGASKLEGLTRILEAETFDAMLIFARTKIATTELAEKLEARGFSCAALNGDLDQKQRERTVQRLKDGTLDIVVATDVAARGLDVERISHVLNYDIPTDTESYVHRIGRTGRAGRSGEAILFMAPREQHLLRAIERATRQPITMMSLPSEAVVQDKRMQRFQKTIFDVMDDPLSKNEIDRLQALIEQIERERSTPSARIAAVLAILAQGQKAVPVPPPSHARPRRETLESEAPPPPRAKEPPSRQFFAEKLARPKPEGTSWTPPAAPSAEAPSAAVPAARPVPPRPSLRAEPVPSPHPLREKKSERKKSDADEMETFRVEVGESHGVKPGNLVGAIANEAGLDGEHIGKIDIRDTYSLVDLPVGMPRNILRDLQKVWVSGQQLKMSRIEAHPASKPGKPHKGPRPA